MAELNGQANGDGPHPELPPSAAAAVAAAAAGHHYHHQHPRSRLGSSMGKHGDPQVYVPGSDLDLPRQVDDVDDSLEEEEEVDEQAEPEDNITMDDDGTAGIGVAAAAALAVASARAWAGFARESAQQLNRTVSLPGRSPYRLVAGVKGSPGEWPGETSHLPETLAARVAAAAAMEMSPQDGPLASAAQQQGAEERRGLGTCTSAIPDTKPRRPQGQCQLGISRSWVGGWLRAPTVFCVPLQAPSCAFSGATGPVPSLW